MRKFKITEEQRQYALKEGITLNADVDAAGGDIKKAVEITRQQAQKSGVDPKKATIQIQPSESKIITKKQMMEKRLNRFKKNSELYTVNEFIKKIGRNSISEGQNYFGYDLDTGRVHEDFYESEEDRVLDKLTEILRPFGTMRQGFRPCHIPQIIDVMEKAGWKYLKTEDDAEGDKEIYFTDGKDKAVIYYDNFYFKIQNIHAA